MAEKGHRRKKIKSKLLHKYRLVILNESTFEEKVSFKLNRLNVFVAGTLFTIVLIAFTTLLIAFTPLREYIPGYASTRLKRQATELTYKTDSLVQVLEYSNLYLDRIRTVLSGDIPDSGNDRDSVFEQFKIDPASIDLQPIREDSILRAQVALEDKYNLFEGQSRNIMSILLPPLAGSVSQGFDATTEHFAVDIVAVKDTPVMAVADGTVVFSDWTVDTGYVVLMEHADGLISVYKHNGVLFKQQGNRAKAGEVIAAVGNTGELTTGTHLHFELWQNGRPVNPEDYIDF